MEKYKIKLARVQSIGDLFDLSQANFAEDDATQPQKKAKILFLFPDHPSNRI